MVDPALVPPTGGPRGPGELLIKLLISLLIAATFVWIFHKGGLPLLPDREALGELRWWCVPAYTAVLLVVTWLRTYRWHYLLRPIGEVPRRQMMGIGLVGYGLITFAPLRMGELARPYLVAREGKVTFLQAMGTVAAERIIDGLVVSVLLLLGLLTSRPLDPLPDHLGQLPLPVAAVPRAAYGALALFACAFVAMGLFYWARDWARRVAFAVLGVVSERLARFVTERIERVADGLSFLPSRRDSVPFFRDTLVYWFFCVLLAWVGFRGCGIEADLAQTCVIMGVMGLGILIPSGPGFFGAYQISAYCALAMFYPEPVVLRQGAAYVFITYTTQVAVTTLGTLVGMWLMRRPASA